MTKTKRPGLGRGLDALLAGSQMLYTDDSNDSNQQTIPIDKIIRGVYQPRRHFDSTALEELAESIREQGILQPIITRQVGSEYEIIAGERRWRAAQLAGLETVPAIVKALDDQAAAAAALIENIQREDLNPLEESQALQRLIHEFKLTHQEAAQAVGRSRTAVTNLLRLLELPETVKVLIDEGKLSMGHARALLSLPETDQLAAAEKIISKRLSVREAEKLIKARHSKEQDSQAKKTHPIDPNILALERELSDQLAAKVSLQHGQNGRGQLIIHYNSLDELDGILTHVQGASSTAVNRR